jgi:DNA processing protein
VITTTAAVGAQLWGARADTGQVTSPPDLLQRSDPRFPAALFDLPDPPGLLACLGSLPDLTHAVAIVGTRSCDTFARDFTRRLAREIAQAGPVVISGGAFGIDTAAHEGALEGGGATVAVLPSGVQRPYPASNRHLFEQITRSGCLVSEHPEPIAPRDCRFLQRNRLIAALAQVVVVVQAPFASGAMSTADWAKRLKRPILGVPHAPWDLRGQGCLHLVAEGAGICRTSKDVLTLAAPAQAAALPESVRRPRKVREFQGLDDDQRAVVRGLSKGPLDVDSLCQHSRLPAPRVQRAVLMLLLSGVIQEISSGRYARADYP